MSFGVERNIGGDNYVADFKEVKNNLKITQTL